MIGINRNQGWTTSKPTLNDKAPDGLESKIPEFHGEGFKIVGNIFEIITPLSSKPTISYWVTIATPKKNTKTPKAVCGCYLPLLAKSSMVLFWSLLH